MKASNEALAKRVHDSCRQLAEVAPTLNSASDRLGVSVSKLEDHIKPLGLGVTSWVPFSSWHSQDGFQYSFEEIGYAKIGGKWGIAIRTRSGNEAYPEDDGDSWAFNEAPRDLRVRAVAKIPDLLEKLIKDTASMAKTVAESADQVDIFAEAFTAEIPTDPKVTKR
jgi:hypothetical protein